MALKSREIRELLSKDHDPKLVKMLCMLADELRLVEKSITELALHIDKLIDHTMQLQNATHNLSQVTERLPGAAKIIASLRKTGNEDLGGDDGHGSN